MYIPVCSALCPIFCLRACSINMPQHPHEMASVMMFLWLSYVLFHECHGKTRSSHLSVTLPLSNPQALFPNWGHWLVVRSSTNNCSTSYTQLSWCRGMHLYIGTSTLKWKHSWMKVKGQGQGCIVCACVGASGRGRLID